MHNLPLPPTVVVLSSFRAAFSLWFTRSGFRKFRTFSTLYVIHFQPVVVFKLVPHSTAAMAVECNSHAIEKL